MGLIIKKEFPSITDNGSIVTISATDINIITTSGDLNISANTPGIVKLGGNAVSLFNSNTFVNYFDIGISPTLQQPTAITDATGGLIIDVEARAAINQLLLELRNRTFIAP